MPAKTLDEEGILVFAQEVRDGLSRSDQKELPARYLYDDLGSSLFEAITHVPEYGLTRADNRLLERLAPELPGRLPAGITIAELGSGSGKKTRWVLEAFSNGTRPLYCPIDISAEALRRCRRELEEVADVRGFHNTYIDGLREATATRPNSRPLLLLFLGSNIGNFDRFDAGKFLADIRACLEPGDALLLGADLMKPVETLLLAYDDLAGVTSAFNRNVLGRINRELGADFDLRGFVHEARYNSEHRRIEMHLCSLREQTVHIPGADSSCTFAEGESIWTEASHKFTLEELHTIAARAGFKVAAEWVDREWPFAECLWMAG